MTAHGHAYMPCRRCRMATHICRAGDAASPCVGAKHVRPADPICRAHLCAHASPLPAWAAVRGAQGTAEAAWVHGVGAHNTPWQRWAYSTLGRDISRPNSVVL